MEISFGQIEAWVILFHISMSILPSFGGLKRFKWICKADLGALASTLQKQKAVKGESSIMAIFHDFF